MAHLTPAQATALKALIAADPVMSVIPLNLDGSYQIAALLNAPAVPAFQVWATGVAVDSIFDAITWSNLTPQDASPVAVVPSAPTAAETYALALYQSRVLICQTKQLALQILLAGRASGSVNAARPSIRAGLQDALVSIPSGAAGVNKAGGWPAVQLALQRPATVLEKLFAVGTGSTASPATMVVEGDIGPNDLQGVRTT